MPEFRPSTGTPVCRPDIPRCAFLPLRVSAHWVIVYGLSPCFPLVYTSCLTTTVRSEQIHQYLLCASAKPQHNLSRPHNQAAIIIARPSPWLNCPVLDRYSGGYFAVSQRGTAFESSHTMFLVELQHPQTYSRKTGPTNSPSAIQCTTAIPLFHVSFLLQCATTIASSARCQRRAQGS